MDWENPLRSIAATVDADVLKVLAGIHEPVTGNELARLAGRSYAQVYVVVGRMVDEGLVLVVRYGRTNTFRLNRDHVLVQGILRVLTAPARLENEIRQSVQGWSPPPEVVALSGSAARRRTASDGEIDVVVVRPDTVERSDPAWRGQVDALTHRLEQLSGNDVQLIEIDRSERHLSAAMHHRSNLTLPSDARTVFER